MILGYICGKFSYFDDDQRQGLNKVVLNIALPAGRSVRLDRQGNARDAVQRPDPRGSVSVVGVVGMFMLSYWLCRKLFHHSMQEAAVCALIAGSPTIGFLGFAVLDPIYGDSVDTNLVIAIVAIVVNAIDDSHRHVPHQPRPGQEILRRPPRPSRTTRWPPRPSLPPPLRPAPWRLAPPPAGAPRGPRPS